MSTSFLRLGDARQTIATAQAPPERAAKLDDPSLLVMLTAAAVTTVVQVVNCISVAVVLRGSWPNEFIDPLYRYCVYGFVLHQVATSAISNLRGVVAPSAFENIIVFVNIREIVCKSMEDEAIEAQFVTLLVCMGLSALISSVFLTALSIPQVNNVLKYLPDYVRHGVFMAIGIGIFMLGFDAYELDPFETSTWTNEINLLKWLPAYILGGALWHLSEHGGLEASVVLMGFIIAVIGIVQMIKVCIGMSTHDAVSGGWLLAEIEVKPLYEFFEMTYGSLDKVNVPVVFSCLPLIFTASLVGPVVNISLNLIIAEQMLEVSNLAYPREFLSQALGHLLVFLGFGYNSYYSIADTMILRKAGGTNTASVLLMLAMLLSLCLIPPVMPFLTVIIPVLLPAVVFVYIGILVVLDCLSQMKTSLAPMEYAFSLLTCCFCVATNLPTGLSVACLVCMFQKYTLPVPSLRNSEVRDLKTPTSSYALNADETKAVQLTVA